MSGENTIATFPRSNDFPISKPWIKDAFPVDEGLLLWEDTPGLVTAVGKSTDDTFLTLTVGKDAATQEGNAVVAAKMGPNILWSWHIWVTKQTFAANELTPVNTGRHVYLVTPVNLGWVANTTSAPWGTNTFYQWGRKDPFPATGSASSVSSNSATIADNILNPTTFYSVDERPNTSTAYNLWDAKQTGTGDIATPTVKTVYDPCPPGFCVPTGDLHHYIGESGRFYWRGTHKGGYLDGTDPLLFFPASGRLDNTNGSPWGFADTGYCWAASVYGHKSSRCIHFHSTGLNFVYDVQVRGYGFPVRAVVEE